MEGPLLKKITNFFKVMFNLLNEQPIPDESLSRGGLASTTGRDAPAKSVNKF
jgi:hypothetical protein